MCDVQDHILLLSHKAYFAPAYTARGNLVFETEATRKAYLDMPIDHPNEHLPYPAADDDDRGG